jgi:orotate phosphoribosyltransferase
MNMGWWQDKEQLGKEIIELLYQNGMIKTWYRDRPEGWILKSKIWSPFYIDLRPITSFPCSAQILKIVGTAMGRMIKEEAPSVNKIVGVAAAGVPISTAITMQEGIPSCYTRKFEDVNTIQELEIKIKKYGQHELVEGELNEGDNLALVDDLVTKFDTKLIALEQVKYAAAARKINVTCNDVVVLFDREQGAQKTADEMRIKMHSLIQFKSKGIELLKNSISKIECEVLTGYLSDDMKYQDKETQIELMNLALNRKQ